ncbi:MAG: NAD(P)-dependent oxidoreductase [Candidatus Omnitrophota bacterium]|nr:NAD(P)-dependent oxidoreductase [Candidatus Omnitrophota bacterium]
MKVIVFGGSGFLGSHVSDELTKKGYKVTIYDLNPSPYLQKSQEMVLGNILDPRGVGAVVEGADAVYNFAGISDIDEAKVNPIETIRQNILGNSIIVDACRKNGVKRFLFASSIYVYSKSGSFYRTCKQASELIIEDYQKAYGVNFTIMRYGSLYGPRSDDRNWIFSILKQAVRDNKITRKGDGEEIREYIHVHDAARISVEVLDEQYNNDYVVISGNQPIKIKDLLVMIREMMSNKIDIEYVASRLEEHYEITPYTFKHKIARKIVSGSYFDLGQGILNLLGMVYNDFSHSKKE